MKVAIKIGISCEAERLMADAMFVNMLSTQCMSMIKRNKKTWVKLEQQRKHGIF